ncbi:IS1595 family transposase [Limibacter armeniacum]|uniref:IS1595 family transposase n=1 Tax=Limibacter armeniacum TaxID=466084 RepID=UPI002FE63BB8
MQLIEFITHFPDEESCKKEMHRLREKQGITCKKCGGQNHHWCSSIEMWQCKSCRFRTSLKSGTVLENSKLPLQTWFLCLHLMSSTKKPFSALEVQRQLGQKRYEPVWAMMHKIRAAMGKRDSHYQLEQSIELDDAFFKQVLPKGDPRLEEPVKRGKGSQRQAKVMVMVESEPIESPKKGKKHRSCGYLKMQVVDDLTSDTVLKVVRENISSQVHATTDSAPCFDRLTECIKEHTKTFERKPYKVLPWVHTAISNAKRYLLASYHMISEKHMQKYLDEFCYKFNRRYFNEHLFDRLLVAIIDNQTLLQKSR